VVYIRKVEFLHSVTDSPKRIQCTLVNISRKMERLKVHPLSVYDCPEIVQHMRFVMLMDQVPNIGVALSELRFFC
jgi:hypothetical protein